MPSALIAQIGNSDAFVIGSRRSVRAPDSGRLYLGVNDDHLADNTGDFEVMVTARARSRRGPPARGSRLNLDGVRVWFFPIRDTSRPESPAWSGIRGSCGPRPRRCDCVPEPLPHADRRAKIGPAQRRWQSMHPDTGGRGHHVAGKVKVMASSVLPSADMAQNCLGTPPVTLARRRPAPPARTVAQTPNTRGSIASVLPGAPARVLMPPLLATFRGP